MPSQHVTQQQRQTQLDDKQGASILPIAVAIGIVVLLVFAAKILDIPVRQDLTVGSNSALVVQDWKGNSGSLPQ